MGRKWVCDCSVGERHFFFENENTTRRVSVSLSRTLQFRHSSMECRNQADMDVSGRILRAMDAGHPCRHDDDLHFHYL
jgi:hypothetical protein